METRLFGPLEVDDDKVYLFPEGLYGFEGLRRFVLLEPEPGSPWKWLQSLDDGDISFVILDPFVLYPGYDPSLPAGELERIGLRAAAEAAVFAVAVVPEDLAQMTVNLRAPLVFNPAARLGRQVILPDERYAIRHPAFPALAGEGARAAGSSGHRSALQVAAIVVGG